jgi:hypothetical protein
LFARVEGKTKFHPDSNSASRIILARFYAVLAYFLLLLKMNASLKT